MVPSIGYGKIDCNVSELVNFQEDAHAYPLSWISNSLHLFRTIKLGSSAPVTTDGVSIQNSFTAFGSLKID